MNLKLVLINIFLYFTILGHLSAEAPEGGVAPKFDYGLSTFKKGNCMGCHKWHGDGGPGYGGAALRLLKWSLRASTI